MNSLKKHLLNEYINVLSEGAEVTILTSFGVVRGTSVTLEDNHDALNFLDSETNKYCNGHTLAPDDGVIVLRNATVSQGVGKATLPVLVLFVDSIAGLAVE